MRFLGIVLVFFWLALDQGLKAYSLAAVPPYPQAIDLLPGFLSLTYIENRGAAWSLFAGSTPALTLLRLAVGLGILVYLVRTTRLSRLNAVALGLIAGGAIGNALDGLRHGFVVDMLLSYWLTAVYRPFAGTVFPIFNLADVGVVSGVSLLLIGSLAASRPERRARA